MAACEFGDSTDQIMHQQKTTETKPGQATIKQEKLTAGLRLTSGNNERGDQGENKMQRKNPPTLRTSLGRHWWEEKRKNGTGKKLALPPPPPPTPHWLGQRELSISGSVPHTKGTSCQTLPPLLPRKQKLCPFASQTTTTRRLCGFFIDRGTK